MKAGEVPEEDQGVGEAVDTGKKKAAPRRKKKEDVDEDDAEEEEKPKRKRVTKAKVSWAACVSTHHG